MATISNTTGTTLAYQGISDRAFTRAQEAPRPPERGTLATMRSKTEAFYNAISAHAVAVEKVGENTLMSGEGHEQERQKLHAGLEREAADIISAVHHQAVQYMAQLEAAIEPASAPDEARLANTRTDAQMALQNVKPEMLIGAIQELAEGEDQAMNYLILMTAWPKYYLRSRNAEDLLPAWESVQKRLMGQVLTENGMRAYQSLDAARGLLEVPKQLTSAFAFYMKDSGFKATLEVPQQFGGVR